MPLSRRTALTGIAALALSDVAGAQPAPSPLARALAETQVPGAAALTILNFAPEREDVTGVRRLGAPQRVARGERWNLGSNGKAMTATVIARLVERGVLAWDRPLHDMLPDLAPIMHTAYRDATLPDLLSHRAGLPENHADMDFFATFYDDTAPLPQQRLRYLDRALRDEPIGPARGESSYSNTGYFLASAAAEHATQTPFETLIVEELFRPLGMRSVRFDQPRANEPSGHTENRIATARDANPSMITPAGGFRMTMRDWAKFCIDQMQGEHGRGRLLSAETYRVLHTAQGDTNSALGWGAAAAPMGRQGPALTHAGTDGNWYALVMLFPGSGNGVIAVANAGESVGGDAVAMQAMRTAAPLLAPAVS